VTLEQIARHRLGSPRGIEVTLGGVAVPQAGGAAA
jgi:hypothetical protein